jgi:uncharacterized membrane protein YcaP (DUF421 family)
VSFAFEAGAVVIFGFVMLRLAGKKVMAEMTPLEMVTVLAIGTIIGHAVVENQFWKTLVCLALFVFILRVFQFLALKFRWFERVIIGRPTLVILDGKIVNRNLAKLRMTMEQLELRLRRKGISDLADVRTATIEVDGRIGYELVPSAMPLTRGQAEQILGLLHLQMPASEKENHRLFEQIRRLPGDIGK